MTPPGIEVRGPAVAGGPRSSPTTRSRSSRTFSDGSGPSVSISSSGARSARSSSTPASAPGSSWRRTTFARIRLAGGADSGRPPGSTRRDHRPGRGQDDDQRPELRGARLHGRPRGRPLPDVGERRRRSGRNRGRDARCRSPSSRPRASRIGSASGRRRLSSGRAAGTWSSRTSSSMVRRSRRRSSISGCTSSIRARRRSNGERPVPVPRQARVASRGAPLERGLRLRPDGPRHPARNDPRDRPDRDDPRRLRDGRDPVRAPRARGRAQRGALGLPVQRHQEVPDVAGPRRRRTARS